MQWSNGCIASCKDSYKLNRCVHQTSLIYGMNQPQYAVSYIYQHCNAVIPCPRVPYRIPNGYRYYRYYFGYDYSNLHLEGSIVRYYCYYGYLLLGDNKRTCQANGTWSGEQPQCGKLLSVANQIPSPLRSI